jgi:heat shock protein HspQ
VTVTEADYEEFSPQMASLGYSFLSGGFLYERMTMESRIAKFGIGQVVKHRKYPFRGIIYDVDPICLNTDEWWLAIPEDIRPRKDQPFYHLFAENADTEYDAYVSEQNLLPDTSNDPVRHPQVDEMFVRSQDGAYQIKTSRRN